MSKFELSLPAMGEGIIEATIIRWLKEEGEQVEADEPIVEIATDKVDSEVPSPIDGVLHKQLFKDGDIPKVGEVIAILSTDGKLEDESADKQEKVEDPKENVVATEMSVSEPLANLVDSQLLSSRTPGGKFLTPLVRKIAQEENITIQELDTINGSGLDGRLTKGDVLTYLTKKDQPLFEVADTKVETEQPKVQAKPAQPVQIQGNYEVEEMDRMRKLIADHMVHSVQTSPHVTSFHEVDVTRIVEWRNKVKKEFQNRENEKLTFTPIFVEAVVKTIKDFPRINVSVDGNKIYLKRNINIGMATALPNGNLIVPVIKEADQKNLIGLTQKVNDLANRARENKLLPDEIQGGTFTITNLGSFGNLSGTPIINQPEVAILALGAIKKRPAVIETEEGDYIGIRQIMIISLSYDHRVVDGALGGLFLKQLADYLENFDTKRKS